MRPKQRKALGRGEERRPGLSFRSPRSAERASIVRRGALGGLPSAGRPGASRSSPAPGGVLPVLVEPSLAATQPP